MSNGNWNNDAQGGKGVITVRVSDEMTLYDLLEPRERFAIGNCAAKVSSLDYVLEKEKDPDTLAFLESVQSPFIPRNPRTMALQQRLDRRAIALMRRQTRFR